MITFVDDDLNIITTVDNCKDFCNLIDKGHNFIIDGIIYHPTEIGPGAKAIKNLLLHELDLIK